jgi:predicted DNA-binding transcriptional regulator YafY
MLNEIKRLQYIDNLIREHKTGNAEELAEVVGVSVRTVYKYLDIMKKFGAPIAFNALSRTYYYEMEGSFVCAFRMTNANDESGAAAMKLSMISINDLIKQMNKTMTPNNN